MIKDIFKVEEIQAGEPRAYNFPANSKVTINDFQLKKDRVAEVEVTKLNRYCSSSRILCIGFRDC